MADEANDPDQLEALDNPHRLEMKYFRQGSPDGLYLTGCAAVTVIVFIMYGLWAAFGVMALGGLFFIRLENYRLYLLLQDKVNGLLRRRHPEIMVADDTPTQELIDSDQATIQSERPKRRRSREIDPQRLQDREDRRSIMPYSVWRLGLSLEGEDQVLGNEIGMVLNRRRGTNSFAIVADGDSMGLTSLAPRARRDRLDQFGDIMRNATYLPGYGVTYACIFRQDPVNPFDIASNNGRWQHPAVFRPQPLSENPSPEELRMHNVAINAVDGNHQVADLGRKPQMVIMVTVRQDQALKVARDKGLDVEDIPQLTVTVVADAILNSFREFGLANPRILDGADMHAFLRGAWDVTTIKDYQKAILVKPELRHADQLHWPQQRMEVFRGHSKSDGTYSTVIRIKSARSWISDSYWHQLFSMDIPNKSIAIVNEAVQTKGDIWAFDRVVAFTEQTRGFRSGFQGSLDIEADIQRKKDRRQSLYEAGVRQQSSIYLTLRAGSVKELTTQMADARRFCEAPTLGLSVSPIMSPDLQYPALMAGTTGLPW